MSFALRNTTSQSHRISDDSSEDRTVPSFIEPLPPLISNPFMRPRPVKGTNLMERFEEDSEYEEPELLQVYLRLKPCKSISNMYEVRSDRCLITSTDTATAGHGSRTQHSVSKMYTFSKIFGPNASQKDIFEDVVKDNLRKLAEGHSYTLLTYGASGSGKTYTLIGTVEQPGLVPRSLEYVFRVVEAEQLPLIKPSENGADRLNAHQQEAELQLVKKLRNISAPSASLRNKYRRMSTQIHKEFSTTDLTGRTKQFLWVSFVEIYNEGLYDLLSPCDKRTSSKLHIREDSSGQAYVKGASQVFVRSVEEAYDVMVAGKHNLQVAETGVHARSSRSHCIFTITLLTLTEGGKVGTSCVRLCDLAGSERAGRTGNTGARMQESRSINSSLLVLEKCLHTLRRKQKLNSGQTNLVPFRESKLTRLLGSGLSGARGEPVSMVVTVNPDPRCTLETRPVLQLAAVAKDIQVNNTTTAFPESMSYFEHSAQDSLEHAADEIMRLRSANELLNFELAQALSRIAELSSEIDEIQDKTMKEKTELVQMAKENKTRFYEGTIKALKEKHEAEVEELEDDFAKLIQKKNKLVETLQNEIAVLKTRLATKDLTCTCRVAELEYPRTRTEERDYETNPDEAVEEVPRDCEVVSLIDDDEGESSEDPLNQSSEPSRAMSQNISLILSKSPAVHVGKIDERKLSDNVTLEGMGVNNDSTHNESSAKDNSDLADEDTSIKQRAAENSIVDDDFNGCDNKSDNNHGCNNSEYDHSRGDSIEIKDEFVAPKRPENVKRGTYVVRDESADSVCNISKGVKESKDDAQSLIQEENIESKNSSAVNEAMNFDGKQVSKISKTLLLKLGSSDIRNTVDSNESMTVFERLEKEAAQQNKRKESEVFKNIKMLQQPRTYFPDDKVEQTKAENVLKSHKSYFDGLPSSPGKRVEEVLLSRSKDQYLLGKNNTLKETISNIQDIGRGFVDSTREKELDDYSFGKMICAKAKETSKSIKHSSESRKIESTSQTFFGYSTSCYRDEKIKSEQIDTVKRLSDDEPTGEKKDLIMLDTKVPSSVKTTLLAKVRDSGDIFEESITPKPKSAENINHVNNVEKSVKTKTPFKIPESIDNPETIISSNKCNDTETEFQRLHDDVTSSRVSEFDLLLSHEINNTDIRVGLNNNESNPTNEQNNEKHSKSVRYNLRHNLLTESSNDDKDPEELNAKPARAKRNLRLRRHRAVDVDNIENMQSRKEKLKDIANLQKEFSDVIMDIPVAKKIVKDIASPEKKDDKENIASVAMETQSCPSKSVTRSRRKLFTPRAEPLEESPRELGADSGEQGRLHVPRPSYHRGRARRKL